jgi:hypothetical protein
MTRYELAALMSAMVQAGRSAGNMGWNMGFKPRDHVEAALELLAALDQVAAERPQEEFALRHSSSQGLHTSRFYTGPR